MAAIRGVALVLALAALGPAGLGLAAHGADAARPTGGSTDPSPITATTDTTTTPTPDPPPPPAPPKSKPKPRPSPAPQTTQLPKAPASVPTTVRATPSVTKRAPGATPRPRPAHTRPHARARRSPRVVRSRPGLLTLQIPIDARPSAAAQFPVAAATSLGLAKPIIASILVLSLMLFAAASIPAQAVPWRAAAQFVHQRNVDLMLVGVVLAAAAGVAILLTGR